MGWGGGRERGERGGRGRESSRAEKGLPDLCRRMASVAQENSSGNSKKASETGREVLGELTTDSVH